MQADCQGRGRALPGQRGGGGGAGGGAGGLRLGEEGEEEREAGLAGEKV